MGWWWKKKKEEKWKAKVKFNVVRKTEFELDVTPRIYDLDIRKEILWMFLRMLKKLELVLFVCMEGLLLKIIRLNLIGILLRRLRRN